MSFGLSANIDPRSSKMQEAGDEQRSQAVVQAWRARMKAHMCNLRTVTPALAAEAGKMAADSIDWHAQHFQPHCGSHAVLCSSAASLKTCVTSFGLPSKEKA